jgi:hypothetical protein
VFFNGWEKSLALIRGSVKLLVMIRPFQLRDLALVRRLGERGVLLQAEAALIANPQPVRNALLNKLVGRGYETFVWRSDDRGAAAIVQLNRVCTEPSAHLVFLGADTGRPKNDERTAIDEDVWLSVLDQTVIQSGYRGVHNLIAEVDENGPELPILRRAGFAVYTRQDIWIADDPVSGGSRVSLQARKSVDDWDIQVLYSNIVPGLIHAVEPNPPIQYGMNFVLHERDGLAAFIHLNPGPIADWMRILIHPNAHTKPKDVIKAALHLKQPSTRHPVYCCVRRYQSWLHGSLAKAGFRLWGSQAVMVRHIAQQAKTRAKVASGVLEAQPVTGSTPLIRGFSGKDGKTNQNQ